MLFYSHLYNYLPTSVPVARRVFDNLHTVDNMAMALDQSRLHLG